MDFLNKKSIAALDSLREQVAALRNSIDEFRREQARNRQTERAQVPQPAIEVVAERRVRRYQLWTFVVSVFTAVGTIGAFGAAAIYAGYAKGQLDQFKRQIAMDQRAWLMINIDYSDEQIKLSPPDKIEIPIKLQNIGKTPAKKICGFITVEEISRTTASSYAPNDISQRSALKAEVIYPPLAHTTGVNEFQSGIPVLATPLKAGRFNRGELIFIVHGTIEYEDIFHVHHWFTFCHPVSKYPVDRSEACVQDNEVDGNDE